MADGIDAPVECPLCTTAFDPSVSGVVVDTGGEEEAAVWIHREHRRFEYEDVTVPPGDPGRNSTVVDGDELEQGDSVSVEPGDWIEHSWVPGVGVRRT